MFDTGAPKVVKMHGHLAGAAGDTNLCHKYMAWVINGMQGDPPVSKKFSAILIHPDGKIITWDRAVEPTEMRVPYWAFGSGMDYALGAFYMGASAQEAVSAAIKHNAYCGGEVQWVRL